MQRFKDSIAPSSLPTVRTVIPLRRLPPRRSWCQSPVPRVKRRKRRNGFRQSGADWETAAACVKMETESSVLIRPLIATPAQGVSRSCAETDVAPPTSHARRNDFARETTPGLSSMGVGSNWSPCSTQSEPPSVRCARADSGGRLFAAKFFVVVHYLRTNCSTIDRGTRCSGQKRDLGDPSPALLDGATV